MALDPLRSSESSWQSSYASKIELDKLILNGAIDQARLLTLLRSTDSQGRSLYHTLSVNDLNAIVHDAIARPNQDILKLLKVELPEQTAKIMKDAILDSIDQENVAAFELLLQQCTSEDISYLEQDDHLFHRIVGKGNLDMIDCLDRIHSDYAYDMMTHEQTSSSRRKISPNLLGSPLCLAIRSNNAALIKRLYQFSPEGFADSIKKIKNYSSVNPLALLIGAPSEVKQAFATIVESDPDVKSAISVAMLGKAYSKPINEALKIGTKEDIDYLYSLAPKTFSRYLLTIDWSDAIARGNPELFQWLYALNPQMMHNVVSAGQDGLLALALKSNHSQIIDVLSQYIRVSESPLRPDHLGRVPYTFVDHLLANYFPNTEKLLAIFKQAHWYGLTMTKRSEIHTAHAWHIEGTGQVIGKDEPEETYKFELEGELSSTWFSQFKRHWDAFRKAYSESMSESDQLLFRDCLLSAEDYIRTKDLLRASDVLLKRIAAGKPTIIGGGYGVHAVSFLIWGDRFVICNRGESYRRPIEMYHMEKPFDKDTLSLLMSHDADTYLNNLTLLEKTLGLHQTSLDEKLEQSYDLPEQSVGNCSWVSPITAVYALMLLAEIDRDYQKQQIDRQPDDPSIILMAQKAASLYERWLAFEQITALEQLIMPLENKESVRYYPKHALVLEIFRKANMIELDEQMQAKLDRLAKIYAAFLEKPQRTEFLTDLVGFKTLHAMSVTQLITVESKV